MSTTTATPPVETATAKAPVRGRCDPQAGIRRGNGPRTADQEAPAGVGHQRGHQHRTGRLPAPHSADAASQGHRQGRLHLRRARKKTPPETNLVTEDPGLQSNLDAALPELQRVEEKTVDAAVTDDNHRPAQGAENDSTGLALPGLTPDLLGGPGATGDLGQVMQGLSGHGRAVLSCLPRPYRARPRACSSRRAAGTPRASAPSRSGWPGSPNNSERTAPGSST